MSSRRSPVILRRFSTVVLLVQLLRLGLPLLLAAFLLRHALRHGRAGMGLGGGELVSRHVLRALGLRRLLGGLGLELLVDAAGLHVPSSS